MTYSVAGMMTYSPGGVSPGRPYFVMELVKGVPVIEFCDQHKVSIPDRLSLFVQVCHAVQQSRDSTL